MPTHVAVLAKRAGCWRGLLGFSLAATVAVLVANVSDRLSFRSALHGAKQVSQEEWAAMFAKARELAQAKLLRLKGGELPAEFACLRARDADFFQNHAQLRLYTRGELAVYLDFDLNPEWRTITLSVSGTPHRSSIVWSADPALVARLEPKGRVLTVTMDDYRRSQRMWIVLPSELRVVEQDFRLHTHTAVAFPLLRHEAEKIAAAVAAIPSGFRGRLHTAGGSHGIGLRVSFRADGHGRYRAREYLA